MTVRSSAPSLSHSTSSSLRTTQSRHCWRCTEKLQPGHSEPLPYSLTPGSLPPPPLLRSNTLTISALVCFPFVSLPLPLPASASNSISRPPTPSLLVALCLSLHRAASPFLPSFPPLHPHIPLPTSASLYISPSLPLHAFLLLFFHLPPFPIFFLLPPSTPCSLLRVPACLPACLPFPPPFPSPSLPLLIISWSAYLPKSLNLDLLSPCPPMASLSSHSPSSLCRPSLPSPF